MFCFDLIKILIIMNIVFLDGIMIEYGNEYGNEIF